MASAAPVVEVRPWPWLAFIVQPRCRSTARHPVPLIALLAFAQEKQAPTTIYRKDYTPAPFLVDNVDLTFVLNEDVTHVHSKLLLTPNYSDAKAAPPLFLHGHSDVKLTYVKVNGAAVAESSYVLTDKSLTLKELPLGQVQLEIGTDIKPQENTLLEGLYKSGGNFCTQVGQHPPGYGTG
jgi:aminopeptidase N